MRTNQNNNSGAYRTLWPFVRSICSCMLALSGLLWINPLLAANNTPDKLVPINTIDSQVGSQGISIKMNRFCGDTSDAPTCFYENPGSSSDIQMLVLDQKNLQPFIPGSTRKPISL